MRPYRVTVTALVLCAFALGLNWTPGPAQGLAADAGMGELARKHGLDWVVERFASQMDRAINSALTQHQAEIEGATKVVPIIRPGGGAAVGAAQVMGPQEQVDKVQAVAEVELSIPGTLRARGLVPVSTRDVTTVKRVTGVGVSANIKFAL